VHELPPVPQLPTSLLPAALAQALGLASSRTPVTLGASTSTTWSGTIAGY